MTPEARWEVWGQRPTVWLWVSPADQTPIPITHDKQRRVKRKREKERRKSGSVDGRGIRGKGKREKGKKKKEKE